MSLTRPRDFRPQGQKPAWEQVLQRFASTRLAARLFMGLVTRIDRVLMPMTGGRVGTLIGQPVLLLHVCGARTGKRRVTPLLYTKHGEELIVIASAGGSTSEPAWYRNVVAHPDVEVELGKARRHYRAREAEGGEREQLWQLAVENYPGYEVYQRRAGGRRIPVVVLSPATDS